VLGDSAAAAAGSSIELMSGLRAVTGDECAQGRMIRRTLTQRAVVMSEDTRGSVAQNVEPPTPQLEIGFSGLADWTAPRRGADSSPAPRDHIVQPYQDQQFLNRSRRR
jgi:hypothetical protein